MSKRRPLHSGGSSPTKSNASFAWSHKQTNFNFRPSSMQEDRGGTRPIAEPSSVGLVLVTMVIHVCKKSLLYEPRLKAAIYFGVIFFGSMVADLLPIPKTYFSRSNNFFNRFFIKWAWGWLLATAGPWIVLTAYTIGCGRIAVLLRHMARLAFATLAWMFWMNVFHYVETYYGRCLNTKEKLLQNKIRCLQAGHFWSSLDLSGHAFIIIYSSLILTEEAYSLVGWESIKDYIMDEEYSRKSAEKTMGRLRHLSAEDLDFLKKVYRALTPYLRGLFIAMTVQQIIWDVMLMATVFYYHILIEKFAGGVIAILTWYVSYYWIFRLPFLGMLMPGEGMFKYNEMKDKQESNYKVKRPVANRGPTFMGMPIRTGKDELDKREVKFSGSEGDAFLRRNQ